MTLTMYEGGVYASGATEAGAVIITRLPLTSGSKYETRMAAVGPFGVQNCDRLRLVFMDSGGKSVVAIVGQGKNYLRRDGKIGGNTQWPSFFP